MCGRAAITLDRHDLISKCKNKLALNELQFCDKNLPYKISYNSAPTSTMPVLVGTKQFKEICGDFESSEEDIKIKLDYIGDVVLTTMKWNFTLPGVENKIIVNARSETVSEKPLFRNQFSSGKRALLVMSGYFEWNRADSKKKVPYYFKSKPSEDPDEPTFAACIYKSDKDEKFGNFTVLTTKPSKTVEFCHDRMPVIFDNQKDAMLWLNGKETRPLLRLLKPNEDIVYYKVSDKVNSTRNNLPECVEKVITNEKKLKRSGELDQQPITKFFKVKQE